MRVLEDSRTESVRECFEGLFERYGLPEAIRSDNGAPFTSRNALLGLSRLSAWWLALGIDLERGRPGCPQDNGAHERMHLDIRREVQGGRVGRDQAAFDVWRQEYNTERPHEALGMRVPAQVYERSVRAYEGTPTEIDYGGMETRKVNRRNGMIKYQDEAIMITTALGGWAVGLSPQVDGLVEVRFSKLLLGHIDPETASLRAAQLGRPEAGQADEQKCNP
jgi:hypothetical protein